VWQNTCRRAVVDHLTPYEIPENIENCLTPPVDWYNSARSHELEKEKLFPRYWQYVGAVEMLKNPGDFFSGNFHNWPYMVLMDDEKNLKAYYNICPHHATCIVEDRGSVEKLVCPYHGWEFDLKGHLTKAPRSGRLTQCHKNPGGNNLIEIPLLKSGPFIFLHFGKKELNTDSDFVKTAIEEIDTENLHFLKRKSYSLDCNWKVFVDNFLDGGYHVPIMHPGLSDQLDLGSYQSHMKEYTSVQTCESQEEVSDDGVDHLDFNKRVEGHCRYFWAYPNFIINRYGPWMDINWVIPDSSTTCTVVFDYFYQSDLLDIEKDRVEIDKSLMASHQVQVEDALICNRVQKGLDSGIYQQGIYALAHELPMLHFHTLLKKDLSD
jgi:choline monooxygenase